MIGPEGCSAVLEVQVQIRTSKEDLRFEDSGIYNQTELCTAACNTMLFLLNRTELLLNSREMQTWADYRSFDKFAETSKRLAKSDF